MPLLGIAQTSTPAPAAQASAAIAPAKIGWLAMEPAILSTDEGKREFSEIQRFVDAKNVELENLRKELDNLRNQLGVQGSKLTDEARGELEDQIETKNTALERFQQDTQREIENRRGRIANAVAKKMQTVIEKVAKEKGLSAVFYANASRDAWVDPSLNLTEELVKAYNQMYPAGAAQPPAKKQ
jgi:Skp family chaperone for outer membrane proteins